MFTSEFCPFFISFPMEISHYLSFLASFNRSLSRKEVLLFPSKQSSFCLFLILFVVFFFNLPLFLTENGALLDENTEEMAGNLAFPVHVTEILRAILSYRVNFLQPHWMLTIYLLNECKMYILYTHVITTLWTLFCEQRCSWYTKLFQDDGGCRLNTWWDFPIRTLYSLCSWMALKSWKTRCLVTEIYNAQYSVIGSCSKTRLVAQGLFRASW